MAGSSTPSTALLPPRSRDRHHSSITVPSPTEHSPFQSAAAIYQSRHTRAKPLSTPAITATDLRHGGCLSPLGTHLSDVVSERIRTHLDVEGSMPGKRDFKLLLSKSCWAHGSDGQGEVAFARCQTPGSTLERPGGALGLLETP